jgi:hypothetical protein
MKLGSENKKQTQIAIVAGVLALGALYPLYQELFGGPPATVTAPPPVIKDVTPGGSGGTVRASGTAVSAKSVTAPPGFVVGGEKAAEKVGVGGAQLDPTLHMEAMRVTEGLVYSGSGRNIFAAGSVVDEPVKAAPVPIAKARPGIEVAQAPAGPPLPPPPPPINLKFFGTTTTASGVRRAFLLNGDDVFLASTGDVVQRRYRVVSISANSIQVEDIPNTNKQSLPLQPN